MDKHSDMFRSFEEESPEIEHTEDTKIRVSDYKMRSLTTEERDNLVREYNKEHSHLRVSIDTVDDSEQLDTELTESDVLTDEYEGMEPMEKLAHLLGELAKVGNIAVKHNMRFLDKTELDELLAVGQKFLGSYKSSIVSERTREHSEKGALSETEDVE